MKNKNRKIIKSLRISLLIFGFFCLVILPTRANFSDTAKIIGNYLESAYPCPDFNKDGRVNLSDFAYFGQYYNHSNLEKDYNFFADFNWDGKIDENDLNIFAYYYQGPYTCGPDPMIPFRKTCPDYNQDGKINLSDFAYFGQYFSQQNLAADLNQDGAVSDKDKAIFELYYRGMLFCI
ncbi:MAG: dockerin type I domain-containing protein [Patescibacteria group bacterium]